MGAKPPAGLGGGGAELLNPMGPVNISVGWVSAAERRILNYFHFYSNTLMRIYHVSEAKNRMIP